MMAASSAMRFSKHFARKLPVTTVKTPGAVWVALRPGSTKSQNQIVMSLFAFELAKIEFLRSLQRDSDLPRPRARKKANSSARIRRQLLLLAYQCAPPIRLRLEDILIIYLLRRRRMFDRRILRAALSLIRNKTAELSSVHLRRTIRVFVTPKPSAARA